MEIILRYQAIQKALVTLRDGIHELESTSHASRLMQDGLIQRFEYCIDSFWKFLKLYLESVQKVSVDSGAPRAILRLSVAANLINDSEYEILFDCVTDRNMTSHAYNQETAEEVLSHIPLYYETMQMIFDRLEIEVSLPSQQ